MSLSRDTVTSILSDLLEHYGRRVPPTLLQVDNWLQYVKNCDEQCLRQAVAEWAGDTMPSPWDVAQDAQQLWKESQQPTASLDYKARCRLWNRSLFEASLKYGNYDACFRSVVAKLGRPIPLHYLKGVSEDVLSECGISLTADQLDWLEGKKG